jgi:hypothetical protein
MVLTNTQRVGISSTSPNATLDVGGLISSTGLKVTGIVTATYFEGDGSRLTNLPGGASGDRIASGTTNITAHQDRSLTFTTAGSQRMIVGEDGRVGLGTSSPGARLHLVDSSSALPLLLDDGAYTYSFGNGSTLTNTFTFRGQVGRSQISYPTANALTFLTGNAERVRFTKDGTVGIGTNDPSATLDVSGSVKVAGTGLETCAANLKGTMRLSPISGRMQVCQ